MQESTIDRESWELFWRKQQSWEQTFSQTIFSLLRFIASYIRYRTVCNFFGGGHILEVGCGNARSSILLAKNKKNAELIGVDFSCRSITLAKQNSKKYRINGFFILADANYLPFRHESFDMVWSAGVLEHFKEPYPVINEMVRVIKKGRPVLALIPSHNNLLVKIRDLIKKITGYYFDFDKAWGGTKAYHVDLVNAFAKINLKEVRSRAIPLELLIETVVIGWKR